MQIIKTFIPDVLHLRPEIFSDPRGDLRETYKKEWFNEAHINVEFVQDNLVNSNKNVFRGLHFQLPPFAQAKLITVISGQILDIALDLRRDSKYFLQQARIILSAKEHDQLYIPEGFAHGFYVLSRNACITYKVSKPYAPDHQAGIRWDDQELGLREVIRKPILSEQDTALPSLNQILSKYEL